MCAWIENHLVIEVTCGHNSLMKFERIWPEESRIDNLNGSSCLSVSSSLRHSCVHPSFIKSRSNKDRNINTPLSLCSLSLATSITHNHKAFPFEKQQCHVHVASQHHLLYYFSNRSPNIVKKWDNWFSGVFFSKFPQQNLLIPIVQ